MKIVFLIFSNLLFTLTGNGQDSTISLNRFETFSSQAGKILRTESKEIGSLGIWTITKLKATNLLTRDTAYAIKIDHYNYDNIGSPVNSNTLYIDLGELDSVISSLTYFINEENR